MRGPGEFFGTRQPGLPEFRVVDRLRDRQLFVLAKQEAERFVNTCPKRTPEGTEAELARVRAHLKEPWQRRYGLV